MADMLDGFNEMYNDFYGPSDDSLTSIQRRERRVRDKVRQISNEGKAVLNIETEVETMEEAERKPVAVATKTPGDEPEEPKEPEKSGMEELNELIGLKTVKHDVEELVGLAKVRKMREEKGMKAVPMSLHLVFSGNPGTGKTTVARILGKLYKEIGILSTGQMIETDRSGLVAGYVGQTAIKTQKKIQEAMGGVLFIDEAYTLNQKDENFGQEAIDTILKAMEDHRDEFVVIVAGYTQLMKEFIESNPGLKSRFNKFFEFPDYTVDELQQIFELQCKKYQYKLTDEADAAVREEIIRLEEAKGENFANAREVRNLFEKIITNQAARVSELEDVDEETLSTITIDDLTDEFEEEMEEELKARAAREAEIAEALRDVAEMNGENQPTAEERAGELVELLKEMAEEESKADKAGKKKKIKVPEKKPIIRR
ncbi:MAG: AAA family ATPase [Mogibacterium sp.]|nr:AAA family ATPase [Mogibacterium sp.]